MRHSWAVVLTAGLALTSPAAAAATGLATPAPRATRRPSAATQRPPSAKPGSTAKPHGTLYVIKTGDTLYAIAIHFKVTMAALLAANPGITNSNQVTVGQTIVIPKP
jgi:LysM repeat protein